MNATLDRPALPASLLWIRDPSMRRSGLVTVRRSLNAGWPVSGPDREALRSELGAMADAGELRPREAATAAAILARIGPAGRLEPAPAMAR